MFSHDEPEKKKLNPDLAVKAWEARFKMEDLKHQLMILEDKYKMAKEEAEASERELRGHNPMPVPKRLKNKAKGE